MAIPLFYQHSSSSLRHLLSLETMNKEFYPYIFSEELYVLQPLEQAPKTLAVTEKIAQTPATQRVENLTVINPGLSSALCIVLWGEKMQLQGPDQELLHKILQACKLNPADIAVLAANTTEGLLFTDQLPAAKAIVFCDATAQKSAKQAQLALYQNQTVAGKQLLLSDPLSSLAQDTTRKASLWKALQALLGIG